MTTADYWTIANAVCTTKEIAALELRDRHGYGSRLISATLGVSRTAVRERLENADRKINAAMHNPTKET
jgi:predicted DNA-binding protein (UPF0251 family)